MKPNFPAHVRVKMGDKRINLCDEHAKRAMASDGAEFIENLPSDSTISCSECQADFALG